MGRAIPGAEVLGCCATISRPCEPGEAGELVHRGPDRRAGLLERPGRKTARVFRPNPGPGARCSGPRSESCFSGESRAPGRRGLALLRGSLAADDQDARLIASAPDEIATVLYASGEVAECIITSEPDEARGGAHRPRFVVASRGGGGRLARAAPPLRRCGAPPAHAAGALRSTGFVTPASQRQTRHRRPTGRTADRAPWT